MSDTEKSSRSGASMARVRQALRERGFADDGVQELPASTRTAVDAARAVGCEVAQIVKSLVFMAAHSQRPVLVVASGVNRVDEDHIGTLLGEPITRASPEFVRQRTGFAIGGVAPVGHLTSPVVFIDRDLLGYSTLWAAAGTPRAVFSLTPTDLQRLTGGALVAVAGDARVRDDK